MVWRNSYMRVRLRENTKWWIFTFFYSTLSHLPFSLISKISALFAKAVEYYIIFINARKRSYEQSGTARVQTFFISMAVVLANGLLWYLLYLLVAGPILCQSFQSPDDYYYWYTGCLPADTTSDNFYIIMWICLTSAFNLFAVILLAISWDLTSVYGLARSIVFMVSSLKMIWLFPFSSSKYRNAIWLSWPSPFYPSTTPFPSIPITHFNNSWCAAWVPPSLPSSRSSSSSVPWCTPSTPKMMTNSKRIRHWRELIMIR